MLFKVLAGLRFPRLAELRLHFPDTAGLLVIGGFLLFVLGSISFFGQSHPEPLNPLVAVIMAPKATPLAADVTITPEDYLVPISSVSIGSNQTGVNPTAVPLKAALSTTVPIYRPDWLRIPIIRLDAPVVAVNNELVDQNGVQYEKWQAPDEKAAGWHSSSATLGLPGNTVLNGHNNIFGEVFRDLANVKVGDKILVSSGSTVFVYKVTNKMTLKERGQPLETRIKNAQWLLPSSDERLTLVTCWPYWSNEYRLIIVARPVDRYEETRLQK